MTARKNEIVVVFVLTGFGDARTSSEIRGLELRPELMPRAFAFEATESDAADGGGTCTADPVSAQGRRLTAKR
jgi:hypothetical protein